ncbi:MAG: sulfite exporter TauE/SafE family protein [Eubacteriales bacterium]|nr:sulfite exporter TauE/SafE family protein [Eubacteriales bacterium]
MMDILQTLQDLSVWQIVAGIISAIFVGIARTSVSAVLLLAVPIMASAFGAIQSTGLMLLMMNLGDLYAVKIYFHQARWDEIRKLLPPALFGLALGGVVGKFIDDQQFKTLIGGIVFVCLIFLVWQEIKGDKFEVPSSKWFIILFGILSGFATMIGNAAGPLFAIYLLAIRLNKFNYMGTTVWFFMIINLIKLPLQIFVWHNVHWTTLALAVIAIPAIFLGTRIGVWIVKKLPEKAFRYLIIAITTIVAISMFF